MTIEEDADLNDGWLRVLCLEPQSLLELLGKLVPLRWGKRPRDGCAKMSLFYGHTVSVRTWRAIDVTADGELVTRTPVACSSHPGVLEVYARAEEQEQEQDRRPGEYQEPDGNVAGSDYR